MKTSINIFNRLTANEMSLLTTEVKETVATQSSNNSSKSFSAAELWNIQRMKKSVSIRRYAL